MRWSPRVFPWLVRASWAVLPFAAGPALAATLHRHSAPVRETGSVLAWAVWAVTLVATLVPNPISLVVVRCAAPAALATATVASATGRPSAVASTGALLAIAVACLLALLPATAMVFVNGPAYPNERRFPLSPPGPLLLGPLELAWVAVTGLPIAAALLLAARQWIAGGAVAVAAIPAVWWLGRSLYHLGRRWVVFVPAGMVIHDPMSLLDPVLFTRGVIQSLGPAPEDSDSLDLTQRAAGLALELILTEKVPMTLHGPRRREEGASARLLFTPTRPGAVLAEARTRRIRTIAGQAQAAAPPPSTSSPS